MSDVYDWPLPTERPETVSWPSVTDMSVPGYLHSWLLQHWPWQPVDTCSKEPVQPVPTKSATSSRRQRVWRTRLVRMS